ncbi:MAG: holo-ACP synthase [Planctomycetota bacterium]
MIAGIGIDLTPVARLWQSYERYRERFLKHVLTDREQAEFARRSATGGAKTYLAGRWAAKEAAMKALGTGWDQGVGFRQVEVLGVQPDKGTSCPALTFHGKAAQIAARMEVSRAWVSISHSADDAIAQVILEKLDAPAAAE